MEGFQSLARKGGPRHLGNPPQMTFILISELQDMAWQCRKSSIGTCIILDVGENGTGIKQVLYPKIVIESLHEFRRERFISSKTVK